jgi:hypothetical protein
MSNTFAEKSNFSLKEVIVAIIVAFGIGGGIVRFEYKTDSVQSQLADIAIMLKDRKKEVDDRFLTIETKQSTFDERLQAVTTSLTAFIRPEDITLKNKKR